MLCLFISSSLFTNSNWFTFDGERGINDRLAASVPSSSPNSEEASPDTEETDDGQVIGTEDQMETLSLGNGPTEEAEDAAECIKQTNLNTEGEQLESAEGIDRHPDASNGDTEVSTDEAASAVAESSAPATEMQAEGTVDKPAGSSDLDNPVSEASPDTDANGNDIADSAVSPEQAIPNKEVELPMKTDAAVDAQMKTDAVVDVKPETDAVVDVGAKTDAVVDLPSKEVSAVDVEAKTETGTVEANE
jgi:serine/threonine-protein phosphatase 6 regulatory subunit 3